MLKILQIIAAVLTIATGLYSLIRPRSVTGFTGLAPTGPRGITEIRAVLGGGFIALGATPLILNAPVAYQVLGIGYLAVGAMRVVSMFADKSVTQSNLVSLVFEIVCGVILVL